MPDIDGLELLTVIKEYRPATEVIMVTGHGTMESAIQALKAGAFDFVSKPVDIQILRNLVSSATTLPAKTDEKKANDNRLTITGKSPAVKKLLTNIEKLARNQAPVFIHGESGSGKERVARMIHQQGFEQHP